jgi:hypothetical protein
MPILFFHSLIAALLFAALFADVFILRSPSAASLASNAHNTSPESASFMQNMNWWRRTTGLMVMVLVLVQMGLGLAQWMPRMSAYNPAIFHTKFLLVVVLTVLAKIRVFKERKAGIQVNLSRAMFGIFLVVFVLGIWSKL